MIRQLPQRINAVLVQQLLRCLAHAKHIADRERADDLLPILAGDDRGGIGFFIVAPQLGKHLVEADPHGDGEPQLLADTVADHVRHRLWVAAKEVHAARNVQPALINAEGLNEVSVLPVNLVDAAAVFSVQIVVGRQRHQTGGFLLGLPNGLRRLDPQLLGRLILSKNDAVPRLGIAAHRHRHVLESGIVQQLHRGVKTVQVAVQNHAVFHLSTPPLVQMFENSIPQFRPKVKPHLYFSTIWGMMEKT